MKDIRQKSYNVVSDIIHNKGEEMKKCKPYLDVSFCVDCQNLSKSERKLRQKHFKKLQKQMNIQSEA